MGLHIVTGPPCGGKTTWALQQASAGTIVVDFDALADALDPAGTAYAHAEHVKDLAYVVRRKAIDEACILSREHDVIIVHAAPSDDQMRHYGVYGATEVRCDDGYDVVMRRVEQHRPPEYLQIAHDWYVKRRKRDNYQKHARKPAR